MRLREIFLDKFLETKLFEMAYSRQKAWQLVNGVSRPIAEHLIKLLVMPNAKDRYHWVNEINGWIGDIQDIILKPGNKRLKEMDYLNWLIYEPEHNLERILKKIRVQYSDEHFEIPADLSQEVQSIMLRIGKDVAMDKNRFINVKNYLSRSF